MDAAEDAFSEELRVKVNQWRKAGYASAQINNRMIPKACADALRQRLKKETEELIPLVYSCCNDSKLVWQMFSWEEIKPCVEVAKNA